MKPHLCVALCLLCGMAFGQSASRPATGPARIKLTPGPDTTRVDGPVREDGTIDYVAAWDAMIKKGVTQENNAAVELLKALGPEAIPEGARDATFKALKLESLPAQGAYLVDLETYAKSLPGPADRAEKAADQMDEASRRPWRAEEFPLLASWLALNQGPLERIIDATRRPRYYWPAIAAGDPSLPGSQGALIGVFPANLGRLRAAGGALVIRATMRVDAGNLEGAWRDLLAAHRLARLVGSGGTLIDRLVAVAIDARACGGDAVLVGAGELTARQASAMAAQLAALPPLGPVADAVDNHERLCMLDVVLQLARGNPRLLGDGVFPDVGRIDPSKIDWDRLLRRLNGYFDAQVAAMRQPTFARRKAALEAWDKQVEALKTKVTEEPAKDPTERLERVAFGVYYPSLSRAQILYERGTTLGTLTAVGFALAAYRADHERYPATLAELAPQYLKAVPKDPFSGKDLIYKPAKDREAGFLLYSVGDDLEDNGGAESGKNRDVVFRAGLPEKKGK